MRRIGSTGKAERKSGRRTTQPLTSAEITAIRDMAARQHTRASIARALGIGRASVGRVLNAGLERAVPVKGSATRSQTARLRRQEHDAASALRPPHATARQFSRRWHAQCDLAFRRAMRAAGDRSLRSSDLGTPNQFIDDAGKQQDKGR